MSCTLNTAIEVLKIKILNFLPIMKAYACGFTKKSSLKGRALRGSAWTLGGHATNQILRLCANLILTRLLFPEAFGLMALVYIFMTGLGMFSDIGIVPSIIQHKRGEELPFLNTAWTLQVVRGFLLWGGTWLLAGPAAIFYSEPMLKELLPIVGISAVINGFNSTKLASVNRKLHLGRLTLLELGSYIISLIVMIIWAYIYSSVWALVFGGLVGSFAKMIFSHLFLEGEKNFFHWEKEAFHALHNFGRWVFLSSALTFLAGQGDRLLMGRILDVKFLAFFTLASTLNQMFAIAFQQVAGKVLFPSYAELYRQQDLRKFYQILRKVRVLQISLSWLFSMVFIVWGIKIIEILYDTRYADAGWILQILAVGPLVGSLSTSYRGVLFGIGKPKLSTFLVAVQFSIKLLAMVIGNYYWGTQGVIIGIASSSWLLYPFNTFIFSRLSLWQPEVDLPVLVAACLVLSSFFVW